jgi:hypothetical protein
MRTLSSLIAGAAVMGLLGLATPALAKEVTVTGEGKCAKCALHETDKCQNVVQVAKKHKTVTYYLVQNDVSKKFHEDLCKEAKKVTVTGTVKTVDGKKELTATKIELAK